MLDIEYDERKNASNIEKHGVSFPMAKLFAINSIIVTKDQRRYVNETRHVLIGRIMGRLHVMIFTLRNDRIRVISLRKANKREVTRYEKENS